MWEILLESHIKHGWNCSIKNHILKMFANGRLLGWKTIAFPLREWVQDGINTLQPKKTKTLIINKAQNSPPFPRLVVKWILM
jgi:hypothetical protein